MSKDVEITMSKEQSELFSDALADVNCWMDGFTAGGGNYSPGTINYLRELNIKIKDAISKLDK